jgi:hypothetical protein
MIGTQMSHLRTLSVASLCLQNLGLHCVMLLCSLDHITRLTAQDRPSIGDKNQYLFCKQKMHLTDFYK